MNIKDFLPLNAVNGEGFKELFGFYIFIRQTRFCVCHYPYIDFQNNRELHHNNGTPYN